MIKYAFYIYYFYAITTANTNVEQVSILILNVDSSQNCGHLTR
jgi:hypothetical protein